MNRVSNCLVIGLSRAGANLALLLGLAGLHACTAPPGDTGAAFDVMEKSISELNLALEAGEVTSEELVRHYLARIEAFDQAGPELNSIVALNPRAADDAAAMDAERTAGRIRGPLHGIPVLLKDNYDTADMPTTAGAVGLAGSIPPDDAFQVRRLKEAGAVILGKTNMHELARGITTVSSLIGQTRNPYDPTRNPGGSSGGTGAAVGASFAAVGMGSDTCGSIRIPSAHQALVGLRGTRGLASGDGIIPLSTTQDIGGPLARSVEDLAITLDATVGFDPSDPITALSRGNIPDSYTDFLDEGGLSGARIGIVVALMGEESGEQPVRDVIEASIEAMRTEGAELLQVEEPDLTELLEDASVIGQEFKFDFDEYLAQTPDAPVGSLAELVELGLHHEIVDEGVRNSLEVETLDNDDYRSRIARRDEVGAAAVGILEEHQLDALLYPTIRMTARPIGQDQAGSNCALSAISGLPAISVPAGFAEDEMPVGLELLGRRFDEPALIALAYAFEQATQHRRPPDFTPSLVLRPEPIELSSILRLGAEASGSASLVFDPTTRVLSFVLVLEETEDDEVLLVDLHRKAEASENGPSLRRIGAGSATVEGELVLSGRELRLLREGRLYLDVHTRTQVDDALRVELELPGEE